MDDLRRDILTLGSQRQRRRPGVDCVHISIQENRQRAQRADRGLEGAWLAVGGDGDDLGGQAGNVQIDQRGRPGRPAHLRRRMIAAGIPFVVSTYGIYRGFRLLEPGMVPPGDELFAAWLDGIEHFGRPITLAEVAARGRFDFMVTGASAVSLDGVRFGKGHGFFDLEWGMFTDVGIVDETTPVAAVVHDCPGGRGPLYPSPTDILVDVIATPTRLIHVERRAARPRGDQVGAARSAADRQHAAAPGTAEDPRRGARLIGPAERET